MFIDQNIRDIPNDTPPVGFPTKTRKLEIIINVPSFGKLYRKKGSLQSGRESVRPYTDAHLRPAIANRYAGRCRFGMSAFQSPNASANPDNAAILYNAFGESGSTQKRFAMTNVVHEYKGRLNITKQKPCDCSKSKEERTRS